jgi:uncharacterized protein YndB with AHSA1/START domain
MTTTDRIEREIAIDAPVERVWQLVSEPGWWVGDGDRSGQRRHREGDLEIVEDPEYGRYPVRVEGLEPQRYAAFSWVSREPDTAPAEGVSTLVEFWLSELTGGATLVRVMESGFAALDVPEDRRGRAVEDNTAGWRRQLDILRERAEHVGV